MSSGDWVALAGVFTALVSTLAVLVQTSRESARAQAERERNRLDERLERGKRNALATLPPLFSFIADLEAVARAADRDPHGFARYTQGRTFGTWTREVRPIVIGLQVSSSDSGTRTAAGDVVRLVDDALTAASFELEFAPDELSPEALEEATWNLVQQVARLRSSVDRLAELVRDGH